MTKVRSPSPAWSWLWAWWIFTRLSQLDLDARSLTAGERWKVVGTTVPAMIRVYCVRAPARWLLARAPAWVIAMRLERASHRWFRIPDRAAAEHVMLRFDFYPLDAGDHVRIECGRLTAAGYAGRESSEIIYLTPDGQVEPDPSSPWMTRAWAAFWKSKGR